MAAAFAAGLVAVALPCVALLLANRSAPLTRSNPVKERWNKDWRPQPDLNRRRRRERAVSLAELDDGDAHGGEPSWDRTNDPLIKSQMLCQLSYGLPRSRSFYVPGAGSVKRGRDSS